MRLQNFLLVTLIVTVGYAQVGQGFDLLGLFRTKPTTRTTTTPAPENVLSPVANRTSSNGPEVPQNSNPQTCWWTTCESRCPGSAQVAGASQCEGKKGKYKFNCCNTVTSG